MQAPGNFTYRLLQCLLEAWIAIVVEELVVELNLVVLGVYDVPVLQSDIVHHAAVQHCLGNSCNSHRST